MTTHNNMTAIILCGGKSSRMGSSKGLVGIQGKPMIQHVLDAVKGITDQVMIISNESSYQRFNVPCFEDIYKDCGPLGGIYSALVYSTSQKNLILSCDIPFVPAGFLTLLCSQTGDEEALVPEHHGKIEPLCAVYDKRCQEVLRKRIVNGEFALQDALTELITVRYNTEKSGWNADIIFTNINTQSELGKYNTLK